MVDKKPAPPIRELEAGLREREALYRVAISLVRDEHLADDLVQATYLDWVERPPRQPGGLQGWLKAVVRNKSLSELLARRRRVDREQRAAVEPERFDPLQQLEANALRKSIRKAVAGLPDSYRSVVQLRYFEGRTPTEIARRLSLPLQTVKTRLRRGRDLLRSRLDSGSGRDWRLTVALLWPDTAPKRASSLNRGRARTTSLSPRQRLVRLSVVCGSFATLAVSAVLFDRWPDATVPLQLESETAGEGPRTRVAPLSVDERYAAPQNATPNASPGTSAELGSCRVVDLHGRPVPGVEVGFRLATTASRVDVLAGNYEIEHVPWGKTDEDGRVRGSWMGLSGSLVIQSDEWLTWFAGNASQGFHGIEPVIVAVRTSDTYGSVVDEDGLPIPGARVVVMGPARWPSAFRPDMEASKQRNVKGQTNEAGHFVLARAPLWNSRIKVSAPGFCGQFFERTLGGVLDPIVMRRGLDDTFIGHVSDSSGRPIRNATASCGSTCARTDGQGRFELLDPRGAEALLPSRIKALWGTEEPRVTVIHPDFEASRISLPPIGEVAQITLRESSVTLRGRITNESGDPLSGVEVFLYDPTLFSAVSPQNLACEPRAFWPAITNGEGRYEFTGIESRSYRICAVDRGLRVSASVTASPPEADDIVLHERRNEGFSGRVISSSGEPLSGALVWLMARIQVLTTPSGESLARPVIVDLQKAGPDGSFEIGPFGTEGFFIAVGGRDFDYRTFGANSDAELAQLLRDSEPTLITDPTPRIELLVTSVTASHVSILGPDGPLPLRTGVISPSNAIPQPKTARLTPNLEGTFSVSLHASTRGHTIILYHEGREVLRQPVSWTSKGGRIEL